MLKKAGKNFLVAALLTASFVAGFAAPRSSLAAAPSLGTTASYAIVSDTWTNSLNAGLETAVHGNICYTTGPATAPVSVDGAIATPCINGADQAAALSSLNSQPCTALGTNVVLDAVTIGANPPGTFPPGCYSSSGAMDITLSATVTLNGPGVYIFRSGGALTTGQDAKVILTNGAKASDVFWTPGGATVIGANSASSATPTFVGTIIADALGSAGISLGHFANLLGRVLAFGHTVTTDSNTITVPTTLHVIKLVVNANGGTATPASFNVHVKSAGVDVAGSPAPGLAAPGMSYSLLPGSYSVSEDANASYVQTFTGTGCDSSGNVTLATGDDKLCTIVNTDIPAPAPVIISGGGGTRLTPLIGIVKVPTPLSLPAGPGQVAYNYTVWNVGGVQALTNITVTDDKCAPVTFIGGDVNGNGKIDPGEIWKYSCTTTLGQTTTNTATAIGHSDDSSDQTAIATAVATVAVGTPVPGLPNTGFLPTPPLINIVKVPSRLTPFPPGGGDVTYTYAVTNPGVVPMDNVTVTDDMCGPASLTSGDLNGNNLLDPGEIWVYSCRTFVQVSTRNVATAEGHANGFTALGYAFATVLVSAPNLPNTGLPPGGPEGTLWDAAMLIAIGIAIIALYKSRRSRII